MSRHRKSILTEFETSNNQHYVYVPVVLRYDPSADDCRTSHVWHSTFCTLGAAMHFFAHMGENGFKQIKYEGSTVWALDLKPDNTLDGYMVLLIETLLVER